MRALLAILAGGMVLNVGEFIVNGPFLGRRWAEITAPLKLPAPGGGDILFYWAVGFAYAAALLWIYRALLPGDGPGGATALKASAALWVIGRVLPFFVGLNKHLLPSDFAAVWLALALVELLAAGQVVARVAQFRS